MKIKKIISQNRRDFRAIYICEHCEFEHEKGGYDDAYFHQNIIPSMECPSCNLKAPLDYRPLTTKYPEGQTV
jgi:rubrerythrin